MLIKLDTLDWLAIDIYSWATLNWCPNQSTLVTFDQHLIFDILITTLSTVVGRVSTEVLMEFGLSIDWLLIKGWLRLWMESINPGVDQYWYSTMDHEMPVHVVHIDPERRGEGMCVIPNWTMSKFGHSCTRQPGVSIKAGYRWSTTACKTSYRRLFGFH